MITFGVRHQKLSFVLGGCGKVELSDQEGMAAGMGNDERP